MGKTKRSSLNTGVVVLSALKKLTKNTGWTTKTIVKFIKMEYKIQGRRFSRLVSRTLKRGVKLGLLQTDGGRYRLNNITRFTLPVNTCKMRPKQHCKWALRMRSRTPSV